jgi:hypothetical protein
MFWLTKLLALELYFPIGFCCGWDKNLPFFWKLRAYVNFARVSFKSTQVWAFQCWLSLAFQWMHTMFPKDFFFMRRSIRRCIYMKILKIMMCLKWWLWSLCFIVTTFPIEIWMISPTRIIHLWVWIIIWLLKIV